MKTVINLKLDLFDRSILVASTLVLATVIYLLYWGDHVLFPSKGLDMDLKPIGHVLQTESLVKHKKGTDLLWGQAQVNKTVYEDDLIYTTEQSTAVVEFVTGDQLTIFPNSLVLLTLKNNSYEAFLVKGQIEGNIKQGLAIKTKDKQKGLIKSTSGRVKVQNDGKNTSIKVISGAASVVSSQGVVKNLALDSTTTAVATLAPTLAPTAPPKVLLTLKAVDLVSPQSGTSVISKGQELKMEFSWQKANHLAKYTFELAKDADFNDLVIKEETDNTLVTLKSIDASGRYYWRVLAMNEDSQSISEVREFDYQTYEPLTLISPQNRAIYEIQQSKKIKNAEVIVNWSQRNRAPLEGVIEISQNEGFSQLKKYPLNQIKNNKISLKPGKYFARLMDLQFNEYGPTVSFEVIMKNLLGEISSTKPLNDQIFYYADKLSIHFEWSLISESRPPESLRYEILLSKDQKFKKVFKVLRSSRSKLVLTDFNDVGTFYWRVRALAKNGDHSDDGPIRKFTVVNRKQEKSLKDEIKVLFKQAPFKRKDEQGFLSKMISLLIPTAQAQDEGDRKRKQLKKKEALKAPPSKTIFRIPTFPLKWKAAAGAKKYVLKLYDADKVEIKSLELKTTSYNLVPPARLFYWSVATHFSEFKVIESNLAKIEIRFQTPELDLFQTQDGFFFKTKSRIKLPFVRYLFKVSSDANFSKSRKKVTNTNSLFLKSDKRKNFFVKVQIVSNDKVALSEDSNVQSYEVGDKDIPLVKLTSKSHTKFKLGLGVGLFSPSISQEDPTGESLATDISGSLGYTLNLGLGLDLKLFGLAFENELLFSTRQDSIASGSTSFDSDSLMQISYTLYTPFLKILGITPFLQVIYEDKYIITTSASVSVTYYTKMSSGFGGKVEYNLAKTMKAMTSLSIMTSNYRGLNLELIPLRVDWKWAGEKKNFLRIMTSYLMESAEGNYRLNATSETTNSFKSAQQSMQLKLLYYYPF